MKKFFAFAMVLMVLVAALGFNVGSASATGITPPTPAPKVFLNSPYFNDLGAGTQVPATMFVESNWKNVYCVSKGAGQVACEFPKSLAGKKSVTLSLTVGDQTLFFIVDIPKLKESRLPV